MNLLEKEFLNVINWRLMVCGGSCLAIEMDCQVQLANVDTGHCSCHAALLCILGANAPKLRPGTYNRPSPQCFSCDAFKS